MRLEEYGSIFDARNGSFYKYNSGEKIMDRLIGDVGVSNGLAWNLERKKFYFIDSTSIDIKEFDYDPETGAIRMYIFFLLLLTHSWDDLFHLLKTMNAS